MTPPGTVCFALLASVSEAEAWGLLSADESVPVDLDGTYRRATEAAYLE